METNQVGVLGRATLENIQKGVKIVKKAVKMEKGQTPSVVIFKSDTEGELIVGVYGKKDGGKNAFKQQGLTVLVDFTEEAYRVIARRTENVAEIAKVIHKNANDKNKALLAPYSIPYQEYDDLLINIGEFLEGGNSLNIVYSQGVGSFNAYDYIHTEDMIEEVRSKLIGNKTIKGVQILGIKIVQLYIQVKSYDDTAISFTYLGGKDNVYKTFKWDGKKSLKTIIQTKINEAKEYDEMLTTTKLNQGLESED